MQFQQIQARRPVAGAEFVVSFFELFLFPDQLALQVSDRHPVEILFQAQIELAGGGVGTAW